MVILFFLLLLSNQIEESYNYLQEEILFLKENPISKIKDMEIVPYLDETTIKNIIEKDSIAEIDKKISPFIKIGEEKRPRGYYLLYFKDNNLRQKFKYFSFFEYHWEGRDSIFLRYLKFNFKDFNFYLGNFTFSSFLSLIFSHPNYLPIEEYKNLYRKEVKPATIYNKNKSFTGLFLNYQNFSLLTTNKVFAILLKNRINIFYFLKEKFGISYFIKKYFINSCFSSEIAFSNRKEYGIAFSIFYLWKFFTYHFHFTYLNKELSNYTYYQKRDFPYFDTNIKINLDYFIFQVKYLSFFNYQYDSFPHNLSFILKREEKNFDWQFKLTRYLKLTRIRRWSNSFLISKDFKNLSFCLILSDNYYEGKKIKRKYLISPKIKGKIRNWEIILAYYFNYFNRDFKVYNFEEEILEEHSLKENIKQRLVFQINCNFLNFLLKLKFSLDKKIGYITYLSIKI